MSEIPAYPAPARALTDSDVVLGFVGKTSAVPMSALASYLEETLPAAADSAEVQALQVTSSYAYPTGSVKKEALFEALDAAGRLADLLQNIPAPLNNDGSVNEAGWRLLHAQTFMATDAAGAYIQSLYYPSDPAGFAALFSSAGSGSTTPSTITVAPVVHSTGTSGTQVMDQATVTAELETLVPIEPAAPFSPIQTGYAAGITSYLAKWWDSTNNRFIYASGGGQTFGQYSATDHSTWMMALAFSGSIYLRWRLAIAQSDTANATKFGAMIEAQWANWKSLYTDNNFQTGGAGMVNTMDDGAVLVKWLRQIGTYYKTTYGTANADYVKACGYMLELIPSLTARFRYSLRANDFAYGVSSPVLGVAFKSGQYGMLYSAEGDTASIDFYGYGSCPLEAVNASCALWLAKQTAVAAVTPAWQTALKAYAVNTEAWIAAKAMTPAPANSSRSVQGLCYAMLVLDPNVNAANDSTINGGAAQTGTYDPNQTFLTGQNSYFGKDIRGLAATWEAATQAYAALCADLFSETSLTTYKAKAAAVFSAYVDPAGYGRTSRIGVSYLANVRDPHSLGMNIAEMVQAGITLGVLTDAHSFTQALFNTARKYIVSTVNGLPGINPQGQEHNFLEDSWTWEETRGYQGLGGQAQRNYIMMGAHALAFIGATQLFPAGTELAVGSGIANLLAFAQMPSMLGALMDTVQEVMTKEGGQFIGRASFGTNVFYLDYNGNADPYLNFASGKAISYEIANTKITYGGQGVDQFSVSDAGVVKARGTITPSTTP